MANVKDFVNIGTKMEGLKKRFTLQRDKREGLYEEWYENGVKQESSVYENGKRNGLCKKWYRNGQKKKSAIYTDGIKNGQYKKYDVNIQIQKK